MRTASQLFGRVMPFGAYRCFYCAGKCDDSFLSSVYVKDSFTGLDTVGCSSSLYVCGGCVATLDERATITMVDGATRPMQKTRTYSWIVSETIKVAATKAHRDTMARYCVSPPDPPFVICLTNSGQKHFLYRAVVNKSRDHITVTLEGELISYRPGVLRDRLVLAKRVIAAVGRPGLEDFRSTVAARVIEYYGTEEVLTEWLAVRDDPVTTLAAWLAPNMEGCRSEYARVEGDSAAEDTGHRETQAAFGWDN